MTDEQWFTPPKIKALRARAVAKMRRIIRERDEARAERDAMEAVLSVYEARGYRRGVEDAIGVARRCVVTADQKFEGVFAKAKAGVKDLSLAGACAFGMLHMAESIQAVILALLEQTEPGEKK